MSIVSAVSSARDVLKSGGYVISSKRYAQDLQEEVAKLEYTAERVENAVQEARNNLRDISSDVTEWLANAKQALKEAEDLLRDSEKASKTCCRGTLPDLNCRYQFSKDAKDKIEAIQRLAREYSEFKDISFGVGAPTASPRIERGLHPVSDLLRWAVTEIKRQFGYVISSESYAQDLQAEVWKLAYKVDWVNLAVKEAKKDHRIVYSLVVKWRESADKAMTEARDLLGKFKKASKTWCCGTLPDPRCHYEFSAKAKDKIEGIQKLTQGISKFKKLDDFCSGARPGYVTSTPMPVELRDDGVFESRASIILKIMDALAENSNSVVGVYGMGGVGKSYLLLDVERKIRQERSFHWIAKADVSENPDIKRIQGKIAHWLGLTDIKKEEDVSLRAKLLRDRLEDDERQNKKVLIILDSLWGRLDLDKVGIPCGPDNKARGCKLLLTSRHRNVLQRDMGCDKAFRLDGLPEKEARALFERLVGDKVHDDQFKPWVEVALHRCAGVPFLIVAMAKRFKNAELFEWKDALRKMEKFKDEDINKSIDHVLRWSYDELKEEAKALLRLCVVCGVSKPSLENLVRYGFGLGLFQQVNSIEDARDSLHSHIRTLQDSSLLLDSEDVGGFKIHDLVRDFVASVSSRDHHPLLVLEDNVKSVTELTKDELESCEAMCLPNMKELPQELNCPELRVLLLSTKDYSLRIPNSYFQEDSSLHIPDSYFNSMGNLMVLNLTGIRLTRFPSLFQFLANLHTLCFQNCSFEDVAILGNLKGLQILSIMDSEIQRLPKEIGQLVELRSLDLSGCSELQIIEPGVLRSLTNLEELYLIGSFRQWSAGEQTQPTNASLIELNHMSKLCTLHVSIPDPRVLPDHLNIGKLTNYDIRIGDASGWWWTERNRWTTLALKLDPTSDVLQKVYIRSILSKTDRLLLDRMDGNEQSICMLSQEGFPRLKHLQVENNPSIRYILQWSLLPAFKALETLLLENMINLEKITTNNISSESFSSLKVVRVERCDTMEVLFPHFAVRALRQLEEIKVEKCKLMRGIVEADDDRGKFELPNLRVLELRDLPSIENFFTVGLSPSSSTSNDQVGTQIAFFNGQQVAFPRLEKLKIDGLDNLKFMFFPSMVKSLTQLRKLGVANCKKMEMIIMEEEGLRVEISETLVFPMLTDLCLSELERLTCFSREKCSREGRSQDHVQLHSNALFNREVAFPSLEELYIMGMDNIEMIWDDQVAVDSFSKLNSLYVSNCNKLVNVVPSIILGRLLSLERLEARSCGLLKVVFKFQPLNPLDGHSVACSPLKELKLFDLPMLKCIWDKELHRQAIEGTSHELKVSFPFLESLKIERLPNLKEIWSDESPLELSNFQSLEVVRCDGLSNMFTLTMATNLVGLTKLRISKCGLLTEVISDEGGREGHVVAFNQLKCIELDGLIGLRCFYSSGYTLMLPLLEKVIVTGCPKMKFFSKGPIEASKLQRVKVSQEEWLWKGNLNITIQHMFEEMGRIGGVKNMLLSEFSELIGKWHSELNPIKSSWQLESLTVDKCPSFINAIPFRLMLVLENMNTLQVRDCESLEEIFDLEGLEAVENTRVLRSFTTLDLVNLPKLRRLWNKDLQGTMRLNSLSSLTLYKCSNLRHAFIPSMAQCLSNLRWMAIKECGQMEGVIVEEEGQGSAMEKTTFPELKWLKLECLPNLTSFLLGKNHTLECPKLAELIITHCPKMRSLAWQSLIEIDDGTPSLFTPQVQFPQLESIVLTHMDNLSKIWTNNPLETLTFEHLRKLKAQNCKSLKNLFPQWVATSLNQLKKVQVESCGIEEIVANGDDTPHSSTAQVLFLKLTSLVLHDMPRLKSFCPNLPTMNWPFLEELRVTHCDKLNMLSFAASMSKWTQRDDQQDLSSQEAQTTFERDFPNLERLSLSDKDIQMIQDKKFPDYIFGKPKALTLACCHDENAVFPPRFLLERFQNMESLEVFCGSFEDIFPDERIVDKGKHRVLESLTELKLSKLHKLKRVWREEYLVSKILQSIVTLEVWDCPSLTTLFPVVTSFKNLAILVVKNSSGLVHLGTVSAVTNLVHLIEMTIIGCERMKEVVANDGNGEEKVISLANLERLTLQNMPSLECFTSTTSCILRFPSLYYIGVEECPKIKIFSKGTLSTPMLSDGTLFRYSYKDAQWKGDLNKAIQELSA